MYSYFLILTILFNTALTRDKLDEVENVRISCIDDNLCESELPGSKCVKNKCVCILESGCQQQEVSMVVRKLGKSCRSDRDCLIDNAECVIKEDRRMCDCIEEHAASEDGKACLPLAPGLLYPCTEDVQCSHIHHGECINQVCKCREDTTMHLATCYPNKGLGDECRDVEDCITIQNSECYANKCVCKMGYTKGKAGCLLAAEDLYEPCLEDVQCMWDLGHGAICMRNKCECRRSYHFKEEVKRCVQHLMLFRNCATDFDCYSTIGYDDHLVCSNTTCRCKPPFKEFEDDCVSAAASTLSMFLSTFLFIIPFFALYFF